MKPPLQELCKERCKTCKSESKSQLPFSGRGSEPPTGVSLVGRRLLCLSLTRLFNKHKWPGITVKNSSGAVKEREAAPCHSGSVKSVLFLVSTGNTYLQGLLASEQVSSFLTTKAGEQGCILFGSGSDGEELRRAWDTAGIRVFLGSDVNLEEIHEAILAAANGRSFSSKDVTEVLAQVVELPKRNDPLITGTSSSAGKNNPPRAKAPDSDVWLCYLASVLTERQTEIAVLVSRGDSNEEIAEKLFLSVSTVKSHLQRIYKKLRIKRRGQITALNLLPP